MTPTPRREPDFEQFLKVLRRELPDRPTLFEFSLNPRLCERLAGRPAPIVPDGGDRSDRITAYRELGRWYSDVFSSAGYDYVCLPPNVACPGYRFRGDAHTKIASHSLNERPLISNRDDFERFPWPDPSTLAPAILDAVTSHLPEGARALVFSPFGVLENLVDLIGYDDLCFMLVDDRQLVADVTARICTSLLGLYRLVVAHPAIGAVMANDDWGFKTQTMISPSDLREFVYPTHREIVRIARGADKQVLLHSCGQLREVMDDIIDEIGYDAKHSFEDIIDPVETVYDTWGERIAILGGIDVGFLCDSTPREITKRCAQMLERASERGGYALGSGNSIPHYVPDESYFAMTRAALGS
ncbi:MAG: hypothetical protein EA382_10590 [Spirochaetaceae bacterium]|nr:MAG: hypothetical protein EA382_10590 [Spirochaetaceae bacterium]